MYERLIAHINNTTHAHMTHTNIFNHSRACTHKHIHGEDEEDKRYKADQWASSRMYERCNDTSVFSEASSAMVTSHYTNKNTT